MRAKLEVDPSLWVFREILGEIGRQSEMVASHANLDKSLVANELASNIQYWIGRAHLEWLDVSKHKKLQKCPVQCTVTDQAGTKSSGYPDVALLGVLLDQVQEGDCWLLPRWVRWSQ